MPGSLHLGTIFGIEISIHMSWLLIVALLTWSGASGWFPSASDSHQGGTSPLSALLGYLAVANGLLGMFNLVPAFPLNGGRVLRSIVWKISGNMRTATRVVTLAGQGFAYLLILAGFY